MTFVPQIYLLKSAFQIFIIRSMPESTPEKEQHDTIESPYRISWRRLLKIILPIFVLFFAIAYWFVGIYTPSKVVAPTTIQIPDIQESTSSAKPATVSAKITRTADFTTFEDKKLGITFNYPSDWVIILPNSDSGCDEDYTFLAPSKEYLGKCGSGSFPMIYIKPPTDIRTGCSELEDPEKVIVGGKEANKCTRISEGDTEQNPGADPKGTRTINYDIVDPKFSIWYTQYPGWPNHEKDLEQIVSTFKFRD